MWWRRCLKYRNWSILLSLNDGRLFTPKGRRPWFFEVVLAWEMDRSEVDDVFFLRPKFYTSGLSLARRVFDSGMVLRFVPWFDSFPSSASFSSSLASVIWIPANDVVLLIHFPFFINAQFVERWADGLANLFKAFSLLNLAALWALTPGSLWPNLV